MHTYAYMHIFSFYFSLDNTLIIFPIVHFPYIFTISLLFVGMFEFMCMCA